MTHSANCARRATAGRHRAVDGPRHGKNITGRAGHGHARRTRAVRPPVHKSHGISKIARREPRRKVVNQVRDARLARRARTRRTCLARWVETLRARDDVVAMRGDDRRGRFVRGNPYADKAA
jgi:hypothetical protein